MQLSEGVSGHPPGVGLLPGSAKPATNIPNHSLGNAFPHSNHARGILLGLHSGRRVMVAARAASSLAIYCGKAGFLPNFSRFAVAGFSTQPSSIPKPGFAPGAPGIAPPPPGTAASSATAPPLEPGAAKETNSSGAPYAASSSASSGDGSGGEAKGAAPIVPSRRSRLGWAIPIIGLPLMAAFYNYQKEYDREWDRKMEKLKQEFLLGAERRPQTRPAPNMGPPATPAVVSPPAPALPAPPPAPRLSPIEGGEKSASAPAAIISAPKSQSGEVEVTRPGASPPPPPPPTPEEAPSKETATRETVAAPPPPPPPPQPSLASSDVEAACTILSATEAAVAAPPPPADVAAEVSVGKPSSTAQLTSIVQEAEGKDSVTVPAAAMPLPPAPPAPAVAVPESVAFAAATAAALALLQTNAVPSAPLPADLPPGKLGLDDKDFSPVGLIQHAVMAAGAQVSDWSQWPERYAQAAADSKLMFEVLTSVAKWHEAQMAEVHGELAAAVRRSEQLQSAGETAVQQFKELLKQVVESSKEMLQIEVVQAEKRTQLQAEKVRLAEAAKRGEQLEELRLAVGALSLAHEGRVRQAAAAQAGHALAAGAAAVAAAAESGAPLGQAAAALTGVASSDPLVQSAVSALPEGSVSTRSELLQQFRRLRRDLSALSYLPGERSGIVAVAVARLAARLKVDESDAVKVLGSQYGSGGVDAALARTEMLLAAGQLPAAAELLAAALKGTAAEALASDWLKAVRHRAAAEASVSALNAHAAATWASMA